jgi:hypothetical protein
MSLIVRPFNGFMRREGVVRSFLSTVGLSEEEISSIGTERRVNESLGPIALEAARSTLQRIRAGGREPTLRQRSALRHALLDLCLGNPEPSFYGAEPAIAELVERTVSDDRTAFAQNVWGVSWKEMFNANEPRACNAFDPAAADTVRRARYERILDQFWPAADAIMGDPTMTERTSWERREIP